MEVGKRTTSQKTAEAAHIAVRAVQEWLDAQPQAQLTVVFNVFTAQDETLYQQLLY